jgi:hypothetical protein
MYQKNILDLVNQVAAKLLPKDSATTTKVLEQALLVEPQQVWAVLA